MTDTNVSVEEEEVKAEEVDVAASSVSEKAPLPPKAQKLRPVEQLNDAIARVIELEARVKALEEAPAVTTSSVSLFTPNHAASEDVIAVVAKCCGPDFETRTDVIVEGQSFSLTIIPPARLRESPEDRRVKVITSVEGLVGVEEFARKVAENCRNFAFKNGVQYS